MLDCLFYIRLTGADTEDVREVLSCGRLFVLYKANWS